jgi:hypothetical protein
MQDNDKEQHVLSLDALVGRRLSIVRFYANILGLHFGDIRGRPSGGSVGVYALHVDCPWRIDVCGEIFVGNYDRWDYGGKGEPPEGWNPESAITLRDERLTELFGSPGGNGRSWINNSDRYVVTGINRTEFGDLTISLSGGYTIRVFPAASDAEAWRMLAPDEETAHLVFPTEQ